MKKLRDFTLGGQRMTFWDDDDALRIVGHTKTNDRVFRKYMKKNFVILFSLIGLVTVLIPIDIRAFEYMTTVDLHSGEDDTGILLCSIFFIVQAISPIIIPVLVSPSNLPGTTILQFLKTSFLFVSEKMRDEKYAELNYFPEFFYFLRDNFGNDAERQLKEVMSKVSDEELGSLVIHIVKYSETVEKRSKVKHLMGTGKVDDIFMEDLIAKEEEINGRADALMIEIDGFFKNVQQMIDEETKQKVNTQVVELLAG